MMTERIQRTLDFIRSGFAHMEDNGYRLEHSIRTAHIGAQIARAEGFDEEAFIIACLLHDIAYSGSYPEDYDWRNHGRESARMARPFLEALGLESDKIEEICYGIAIHVDDEADFPGERTAFALSVSDADNIDRFGALRLYFSLHNSAVHDMPLKEKREWAEHSAGKLRQLLEWKFATTTAAAMWRDRVGFQLEYHERLLRQLGASTTPEDF